jgi:hypothetical protein
MMMTKEEFRLVAKYYDDVEAVVVGIGSIVSFRIPSEKENVVVVVVASFLLLMLW